jgi:hypothetical protein
MSENSRYQLGTSIVFASEGVTEAPQIHDARHAQGSAAVRYWLSLRRRFLSRCYL